MKEKMVTEFGTARINNNGYWQITSRKEGNHSKLLHRLIFEKYYGTIPAGYQIHHINGIKTDNRIENLQCLSVKEHSSLHNSGESNYWSGTKGPWYGKKRPDVSGVNHFSYGVGFTDEHCTNISKSCKGREPWNKGKKQLKTTGEKNPGAKITNLGAVGIKILLKHTKLSHQEIADWVEGATKNIVSDISRDKTWNSINIDVVVLPL
jgi:hypothetical protein